MSMPQPIHVALVGSTADIVRRAKEHFRLSQPGIGAAYLATLEPKSSTDGLGENLLAKRIAGPDNDPGIATVFQHRLAT